MSESYRLLPGLHLVRRDADHLQLGVDPPRCAVLRDLPEVRRLVERARGRPAPPATRATRPAGRWPRSSTPGSSCRDDTAARRERLRAARVQVRRRAEVAAGVTALLQAAGRDPARRGPPAPTSSCSSPTGELERGRLDPLIRDEVPHLLVRDHGHELVVGPFVVPGATACLRCVDCHHGDADPRRGLVVEQVATQAAARSR